MISSRVEEFAAEVMARYRSNRPEDEYTLRLQHALDTADWDEIEHVTAVMALMMLGRGQPVGALYCLRWYQVFSSGSDA